MPNGGSGSAPVVSSRSGPGPGGGPSPREFPGSRSQSGRASPLSNKVADQSSHGFALPSPTFSDEREEAQRQESLSAAARTSGKRQMQQHGRHGNSFSNNGGSNGGGFPPPAGGGRRPSKMLKPSAHQASAPQQQKSSAPSAAADLASRRWTNDSGAMTFKQLVVLANNPERWADAGLAASNLVDVWNHYDANANGELDRSEVITLASDVVDRFVVLYEEQLRRDQPTLSSEDVTRLAKRDVFPHLLSGDSPAEAKRVMADRLFKLLDTNHDGCITRTEFLFSWKLVSKQMLTIKGNQQAPKGVSCVIL